MANPSLPVLKLHHLPCNVDDLVYGGQHGFFEGRLKRNRDAWVADTAPEAIYLRGVSEYQSTHIAEPLKKAYERLKSEFPSSEWVKRAKPYSLL